MTRWDRLHIAFGRSALAVALLASATAALPPAPVTAGRATVVEREPSAEDGERQAGLVADEDLRLDQVRSAAPQLGQGWRAPFRLDTYGGSTLVLTRRGAPYTIADLLQFGPRTIVRQPDGAYLLTENVYVNVGARLKLYDRDGLTLRLVSTRKGFVSIVSFGGGLELRGTTKAPLKITSWDPRTRGPDTDVGDGRAYVRAMGGRFSMTYAMVSHLGFWSGRTGGLGLSGNDLPTVGDVAQGSGGIGVARADQDDGRFAEPRVPDISGSISHCTVTGNAFGLFVANAAGIAISDTTVENSVGDGLVLQRFAARAPITRIISRQNGGDGFVLSRATQRIHLDSSSAEGNAGNGFTLDGRPLATGPSAAGDSMASYGLNSVSNSSARDNGHYGIEVVGGLDIGVQGNRVEGGDMGIVVGAAAGRVKVTDNQVAGQRRQGIAVRDGVTAATVSGNTVADAETGIYVRDSVAEVRGNIVRGATRHGVTLVGNNAGSVVSRNVIAGTGPRALDISRANGDVVVRENQTSAWDEGDSFWATVRHYASPMTLLWMSIILLVVWSAAKVKRKGRSARQRLAGAHPYADKVPLRSAPPREITPVTSEEGPVVAE